MTLGQNEHQGYQLTRRTLIDKTDHRKSNRSIDGNRC